MVGEGDCGYGGDRIVSRAGTGEVSQVTSGRCCLQALLSRRVG